MRYQPSAPALRAASEGALSGSLIPNHFSNVLNLLGSAARRFYLQRMNQQPELRSIREDLYDGANQTKLLFTMLSPQTRYFFAPSFFASALSFLAFFNSGVLQILNMIIGAFIGAFGAAAGTLFNAKVTIDNKANDPVPTTSEDK